MKKTMKLTLLVCLTLIVCALMLTACDSGNEVQTPSNTTDGNSTEDVTTDGTTKPGTEVHIHAFGTWKITKSASCIQDGSKERYCSCGETETSTIVASHTWQDATCVAAKMCTKCGVTEGAALGHTTEIGTCSRCNEKIMPTITLPSTPISTSVKFSHARTTMKIASITYEFNGDNIKFYYDGEKTYDNVSDNGLYFCGFTYKLYDADGYVVAAGTDSVSDISVGDKFRNEGFTIYNVAPSTSYRLVIEDYK